MQSRKRTILEKIKAAGGSRPRSYEIGRPADAAQDLEQVASEEGLEGLRHLFTDGIPGLYQDCDGKVNIMILNFFF